jgi:hypothetical protein
MNKFLINGTLAIIAILAGLITGGVLAMISRVFKISIPYPYGIITVMVMLVPLLAKYLLRW